MLIRDMHWMQVEAYLRRDDRCVLPPADVRALVGDGNYGGAYERPDADMLRIWQIAVEETRELLATGWAP